MILYNVIFVKIWVKRQIRRQENRRCGWIGVSALAQGSFHAIIEEERKREREKKGTPIIFEPILNILNVILKCEIYWGGLLTLIFVYLYFFIIIFTFIFLITLKWF